MKKLVIAALAAAATVAGGAAFAQAAQAPTETVQVPHPEQGGYIYGNSGWTPAQIYGGSQNYPYYIGQQVIPQIITGSGALVLPQIAQAVPQYPRTARDRDGDGIRNRRDRYPDDPRYR